MSGFWIVVGNNIAEIAGMIFIGWTCWRLGRYRERRGWEMKTGRSYDETFGRKP